MTNNVVQKERFRYFIKVPELAAFYNEITDYRTAEDVDLTWIVLHQNEILHQHTAPPAHAGTGLHQAADGVCQDGRRHVVGQVAAV